MKRGRFVAAAGLMAVACVGIVGASVPVAASPVPTSVSSIVDSALPGASVRIQPAPTRRPRSARLLVITLPNSVARPTGSAIARTFAYSTLGWKAAVAAAAARAVDQKITAFALAYPGGKVPTAAFNSFHGVIRLHPGRQQLDDPRIDSVSSTAARSQAESNIATLGTVLPPGSIRSHTVSVISLDRSTNRYALSIDVQLAFAHGAARRVGDLIDGLQTGLTGGADAVVEGLAITVHTGQGPMAGSWQAVRAGSGNLQFDRSVEPSATMTATRAYPDFTGGPETVAAGVGGTSTQSGAHPGLGSPGHPTNPTADGRGQPGHRDTRAAAPTNQGDSDTWSAAAVGIVLLATVAALSRRRRNPVR